MNNAATTNNNEGNNKMDITITSAAITLLVFGRILVINTEAGDFVAAKSFDTAEAADAAQEGAASFFRGDTSFSHHPSANFRHAFTAGFEFAESI
jgi:hypothetical protein